MDEFSQYAVEEDEFSQYEVKPKKQEDEFSQYAAEEDEFTQYTATDESTPPPKSPDWISDPLTKQDIAEVATKFGLTNREQIESLITQAYLKGGTVEGETRPVQYAVGLASDLALPGDIPAYVQKKWQDDEGVRKAMDAIGDLVEQKKSTARFAGEIIGGFAVPALGISKLGKAVAPLGKIAEGAAAGTAMGTVGGLVESKEGEELSGAATGAVIGGTFGAALGSAGKWMSESSAKRAKDIAAKLSSETGEDSTTIVGKIRERADQMYDANLEKEVLDIPLTLTDETGDVVKSSVSDEVFKTAEAAKRDFITYVYHGDLDNVKMAKPQEIDAQINAILHNHGEEASKDLYKKYLMAKAGEEFRDEVKVQNLAKIHQGVMKTIVRPFEAAMYMADRVDRLTGSNFNKHINDISRKLNTYKTTSAEQIGLIQDLVKQSHKVAKTSGKTYRDINNELYRVLNKEVELDKSFLNDHKDLVVNWQGFWEQARLLNNMVEGEEVIRRWGDTVGQYVLYATVSIDKAVEAIQKRLYMFEDTLPQFKKAMEDIQIGKVVDKEAFIASLTKEDDKLLFDDLVKSVMRINGLEEAPKTLNEIVNVIETIQQNPANALRIGEMTARATKSRQGGTPHLIRETDMVTLAEGWVMNTLKQAYIGKEAGSMKAEAMALYRAGFDKKMTQDMIDLIQDIEVGTRAGTLTSTVDTAMKAASLRARKAAVVAEREGRPIAAYWNKAVAASPAVMQYLGNQIYPNTLGIFTNQRSPIKNLFQPFMMTSADVGFRYALPTVARAVAYGLRKGVGSELGNKLKAMGLHGDNWEGIMNAVLTDPSAPKLVRKAMATNHVASTIAMKFFTQSEIINRFAATELGHKVGKDLVAALANPGKMDFHQTTAMEFLSHMTSANKRDISSKLKLLNNITDGAKRAEITREIQIDISQYLIQKTVFDYNKANASIVARSLPAPLLVFTKFPTYIASDLMHKIETRGMGAAAAPIIRGYMAPWALAESIDRYGEDNLNDDENMVKFFMGSEGLSGITNVGALGALRSFVSPLVMAPMQTLWDVGEAASHLAVGDAEDAEVALTKAGKSGITAASLYAPAALSGPARGVKKLYDFIEGTDE